MSVLLVTVDSLRADRIGDGYPRETTPFLDRLADESVFFERAYSPSSHTREAVPSVLTGFYPSRAVTRRYRIRKPTLGRILSDAGYETGAFVSAPFFTAGKGYDDGFGVFDSAYSRYSARMLVGYARDILTNSHFRDGYDVNDAVVSFARERCEEGGRFFAWAHYMDVHAPYNRSDEGWFGDGVDEREAQVVFRKAKHAPSRLSPEEHRVLVDGYDNGVRYFDGVMRDLFERLGETGVLDETVVVVTSDHGESLGENGEYGHRTALSPEVLRVPLWVYGTEGGGGVTVSEPVSTVDVPATVAEEADVSVETDGFPLLDDRDALREIRASRYGYLGREEKEVVRA